jgi:hypothetical protein
LLRETTLPNFKDPRAAADRIRAAALSLTSPHDINVVRQYLRELEAIAHQQDAEGGEDEAEPESRGNVVPLSSLRIRGSIRKALPSEEHPNHYVLRLHAPS